MANSSFTVQYLLKAKDLFSGAANKASRSMGKLDKSIKKTALGSRGYFKLIAGGIKLAAKGMLALGAASLAALGASVKVGAGFQTAMADMSSITGATGKDLEFYRKETMRLGQASITSSAEVATAFKLIASAKS